MDNEYGERIAKALEKLVEETARIAKETEKLRESVEALGMVYEERG